MITIKQRVAEIYTILNPENCENANTYLIIYGLSCFALFWLYSNYINDSGSGIQTGGLKALVDMRDGIKINEIK